MWFWEINRMKAINKEEYFLWKSKFFYTILMKRLSLFVFEKSWKKALREYFINNEERVKEKKSDKSNWIEYDDAYEAWIRYSVRLVWGIFEKMKEGIKLKIEG